MLAELKNRDDLIVVTGAGGFIGGHLVAELRRLGCRKVRAVDIKPLERWYQLFAGVGNRQLDLKDAVACFQAEKDARFIFNLAADMGGMGFIESHKTACMLNVLINTQMLLAAVRAGCERYLFTSSACVYAAGHQSSPDVKPLKEADAYPAMP